MKKTVLMIAMFIAAPCAAQAQESQVYSPYGQATNYYAQNARENQEAASPQYGEPNTYMVYPGRERYGESWGRIPRHPGDYRDAVDRGSWASGEPGTRSFDIR